jgi:hypothetical protein
LLQDLHIRVSAAQALEPIYREAVAGISARLRP